jgi:hypothetical protein
MKFHALVNRVVEEVFSTPRNLNRVTAWEALRANAAPAGYTAGPVALAVVKVLSGTPSNRTV